MNYLDTAAAYGGPDMWSQKYIGKVIKERRQEVFLASKTHRRTYDESMRLLETSLKLLNTDHLDLWQLHNVAQTEQLDQIFAKDGAIHALEKARAEKVVRFLGITGHADPFVLADGLKRYRFDTILMAVNAADKHHLSFIEHLLPLALEQELGIIGMKIPARGRILSGWTPPPPETQRAFERATRSGTLTMKEAMQYVLSLPVSTVIVGCDTVAHLEENVRIAGISRRSPRSGSGPSPRRRKTSSARRCSSGSGKRDVSHDRHGGVPPRPPGDPAPRFDRRGETGRDSRAGDQHAPLAARRRSSAAGPDDGGGDAGGGRRGPSEYDRPGHSSIRWSLAVATGLAPAHQGGWRLPARSAGTRR